MNQSKIIKLGAVAESYSRGDATSFTTIKLTQLENKVKLCGVRKTDGKDVATHFLFPNSDLPKVIKGLRDIYVESNGMEGVSAFMTLKYEKLSIMQRYRFVKAGFSIRKTTVGIMIFKYSEATYQELLNKARAINSDYNDIKLSMFHKAF